MDGRPGFRIRVFCFHVRGVCSGTFALGRGLGRDLGSGMAGEKWVDQTEGENRVCRDADRGGWESNFLLLD